MVPSVYFTKAYSDNNNKKSISLKGCRLHTNRAGSISLAKNLISGIGQFWHDLDSKNNKKKFSPAQLELSSSFKSDSVKPSVNQRDNDMVRLRKLRIKNPNKVITDHLRLNSIRNKFELLSWLFHWVIDILKIFKTKIDDSFPMKQFIVEGYSTIYRLDRNERGEGIMLIIKDILLPSRLDK